MGKRRGGRRRKGHGGRKKKQRYRKKSSKKVQVKRQFRRAMKHLQRMNPVKQRTAVVGASNKFIRDMTGFLSKIRSKGDLVKPSHRKILRRHRKKLKKLVNPKTSIATKRLILSQKGGIAPALIPVIVALIGAGGGVAASAAGGAAHAAIMKK